MCCGTAHTALAAMQRLWAKAAVDLWGLAVGAALGPALGKYASGDGIALLIALPIAAPRFHVRNAIHALWHYCPCVSIASTAGLVPFGPLRLSLSCGLICTAPLCWGGALRCRSGRSPTRIRVSRCRLSRTRVAEAACTIHHSAARIGLDQPSRLPHLPTDPRPSAGRRIYRERILEWHHRFRELADRSTPTRIWVAGAALFLCPTRFGDD